ncbi:MAG: DNA-3-methyladenine glycosylase I [Gemmatimonadota bacterium]
MTPTLVRCGWVANAGPLDQAYHDREWGVPVHDDARLFEMITLEGAQAGLSWSTILAKRQGYRDAFHDFDPERVARMGARDVTRLLKNPGIVRHRGKIESTIANAQGVLAVQDDFGSLDAYIWSFVNGASLQNGVRSYREIPAETEHSRRLSKDLKKRGFRFVGPTTMYAFMQAAGLVNDHEVSCFRHGAV